MASHTTTNSSPPNRATVSPGRIAAAIRAAGSPQEVVAGGVAERVVDHLELVDVEEHHPQPGPAPPSARQAVAESVRQERPVREAGQLVVERRAGQLVLHQLAGGDVLDLGVEVLRLAVLVAHESHVDRPPHGHPVRPEEGAFPFEVVVAIRDPVRHRLGYGELVVVGGGAPVVADQLVLAHAEERAQGGVDPSQGAVEVDDRGADGSLLEPGLEAGLGRPAHPFGLGPVGVVQHRARHPGHAPVGRDLRHPAGAQDPLLAIGSDDAQLPVEGTTSVDGVDPLSGHRGHVVGVDHGREPLCGGRDVLVDPDDAAELRRPDQLVAGDRVLEAPDLRGALGFGHAALTGDQRPLDLEALGQVDRHRGDGDDLAVLAVDGGVGHVDRQRGAVPLLGQDVDGEALAPTDCLDEVALQVGVGPPGQELHRHLADGLFSAPPVELLGGPVPVDDDPVGVDGDDRLADRVEEVGLEVDGLVGEARPVGPAVGRSGPDLRVGQQARRQGDGHGGPRSRVLAVLMLTSSRWEASAGHGDDRRVVALDLASRGLRLPLLSAAADAP